MASRADHQIPSLLRRRLSHLRLLSPPLSSVQCRWSSSGLRGHVSATEQAGVDGTVNVGVPVVVITGASRGIRRAFALALGKAGCKAEGTMETASKVAYTLLSSDLTCGTTRELNELCEILKGSRRGFQRGSGMDCVHSTLPRPHYVGIYWAAALHSMILSTNIFLKPLLCLSRFDRCCTHQIESCGGQAMAFGGVFQKKMYNDENCITCDALLTRMKKSQWQEGRIVNISSVVGLVGNAGQANYSAAEGVIGLTKSVAEEYASRNITVNAVAPGFIESDMTSKLSGDFEKKILASVPLGRYGQPEVAGSVEFPSIQSCAGSYITGPVVYHY